MQRWENGCAVLPQYVIQQAAAFVSEDKLRQYIRCAFSADCLKIDTNNYLKLWTSKYIVKNNLIIYTICSIYIYNDKISIYMET